jgi:hypothetical protein
MNLILEGQDTIMEKVANCSPSRNVLSMMLKLERLPEEHMEVASVVVPTSESSL